MQTLLAANFARRFFWRSGARVFVRTPCASNLCLRIFKSFARPAMARVQRFVSRESARGVGPSEAEKKSHRLGLWILLRCTLRHVFTPNSANSGTRQKINPSRPSADSESERPGRCPGRQRSRRPGGRRRARRRGPSSKPAAVWSRCAARRPPRPGTESPPAVLAAKDPRPPARRRRRRATHRPASAPPPPRAPRRPDAAQRPLQAARGIRAEGFLGAARGVPGRATRPSRESPQPPPDRRRQAAWGSPDLFGLEGFLGAARARTAPPSKSARTPGRC